MTLETWAIFLPAAFALNCYPGPNNVLAMTHGARFGFSTALAAAAGRFPAFALFVLGAAVGLGAVLAASAEVFLALKIAGAVYLHGSASRCCAPGLRTSPRTPATTG